MQFSSFPGDRNLPLKTAMPRSFVLAVNGRNSMENDFAVCSAM